MATRVPQDLCFDVARVPTVGARILYPKKRRETREEMAHRKLMMAAGILSTDELRALLATKEEGAK